MSDTDLKGSTCSKASLLLNDFIYHNESIFRCIHKNRLLFEEFETKQKMQINQPSYWRLQVLHLIPDKIEVRKETMVIEGAEVGSKVKHSCEIIDFS